MGRGRRTERVGTLLRQAIAALLIRGIKDPRVAGVTVTEVEVSPDLRHACVYYRVLGAEADQARAQSGLERAAGYIQSAVGRDLQLRYTPELRFAFDPSPDRVRRLDELLAAVPGTFPDEGDEITNAHGRRPTRR
jgi:ribosome-binding factor A